MIRWKILKLSVRQTYRHHHVTTAVCLKICYTFALMKSVKVYGATRSFMNIKKVWLHFWINFDEEMDEIFILRQRSKKNTGFLYREKIRPCGIFSFLLSEYKYNTAVSNCHKHKLNFEILCNHVQVFFSFLHKILKLM